LLEVSLRTSRDVEVEVAIPIGCMVPLTLAAAALVGVGLFVGVRLEAASAPVGSPTLAWGRLVGGEPGPASFVVSRSFYRRWPSPLTMPATWQTRT
jgi:hypothetical protein